MMLATRWRWPPDGARLLPELPGLQVTGSPVPIRKCQPVTLAVYSDTSEMMLDY